MEKPFEAKGNRVNMTPDNQNRRRRTLGFSLLELMIVAGMGMVIAAVAVPNILRTVANMRLRSAAGSISSIIQDGRVRAIRANRRTAILLVTQNSAQLLCVDEDLDSTCDPTERTAQIPTTVTRLTAAPSGAGAPTTLDSTVGITSPQLASLPSFNPRGLPCLFASGACTTNTGFVLYLSGAQPIGNPSWAAVSITPAGRVKVWSWTGSAWGN
ncbi:MAG: Tfp pilus assembly protein FimT/FimU [Candidatus Korobacteraceae bacterium]